MHHCAAGGIAYARRGHWNGRVTLKVKCNLAIEATGPFISSSPPLSFHQLLRGRLPFAGRRKSAKMSANSTPPYVSPPAKPCVTFRCPSLGEARVRLHG